METGLGAMFMRSLLHCPTPIPELHGLPAISPVLLREQIPRKHLRGQIHLLGKTSKRGTSSFSSVPIITSAFALTLPVVPTPLGCTGLGVPPLWPHNGLTQSFEISSVQIPPQKFELISHG